MKIPVNETKLKELISSCENGVLRERSSVSFLDIDGITFECRDNTDFQMSDLHVFRAVKKDATKYVNTHNILEPKYTPKYYLFSQRLKRLPEGTNIECIYADVKAAYWTIARNKGVISEQTYEKYISNKKARNAAIGALATNEDIYNVINGEKIYVKTDRGITAPARDLIVSFADRIIYECCVNFFDRFLFYWVDGIFIQKKHGENLFDIDDEVYTIIPLYFEKYDLAVTMEEVTITKTEKGATVIKSDGEKKPFFQDSGEWHGF